MTAYVAGLVAAYILGTVFGVLVQRRKSRDDLLDMDAVTADLRGQVDTLTVLAFGPEGLPESDGIREES